MANSFSWADDPSSRVVRMGLKAVLNVTVLFGAANYTVAEGGTVDVTVSLSANPERTVVIPITASNQGGASSDDYSGVPASVTFNAGEMEQTFTFAATQDMVDDDGESVLLGFGTMPAAGVTEGTPNQTTVSITNNAESVSDIENLAAQPCDRMVTLTWDLLVDSDLTGYQYRYRNTDDTSWTPDWRNISGSTARTVRYTFRNLTNGLLYTFEVRPLYLREGQTVPGRQNDVDSAPRGSLRAPAGLTATPATDPNINTEGRITLSWTDPRDVTLTGYEYRYRETGQTGWKLDWTVVPGATATTTELTLAGLTAETAHIFQLRTLRGADQGPTPRLGAPPTSTSTAPPRCAISAP